MLLKRLRRLSQQLSRKQTGSANRRKAKNKLAALHARIRQIRQDYSHKLTTALVLNYTRIGIEDLHVKGMAANRRLSRPIMDQSFYECRRQLAYKATWYQSEIVVADRFYPSSKRCHVCGSINKELALSDRHWHCTDCGSTHDRDVNAAKNLAQLASTVSSTGIYACGAEGAG